MSRNTVYGNARQRNSWIATAALSAIVGTLACTALPACAEPLPKQKTVDYQDLDLTLTQDVQRLYSRLRYAARSVCAPLNGRAQHERQLYRSCFDAALDQAVQDINVVQLTKLHGKGASMA